MSDLLQHFSATTLKLEGRGPLISRARAPRTKDWEESAWSVLVLAERGTPDQSYFQGGGARSRAHVWTDPPYYPRTHKQAWKEHL